jgi:hypothetical protein
MRTSISRSRSFEAKPEEIDENEQFFEILFALGLALSATSWEFS